MQTKLTLRLEDAAIRRAKAWARGRGVSLSEAVAAFFAQLPDETGVSGPGAAGAPAGPWIGRLTGVAALAPDAPEGDVRRSH